jgi:hypothetical protein
MYKTASNGRQQALDHGKWSDWVTWDERQTLDEQVRNLSAAVHAIDNQFQTLKDGPLRAELIARKISIQEALRKIKRLSGMEKQLNEGVTQFFAQVAKERLMPSQLREIWAETYRRYDAVKAQASLERSTLVDESDSAALNANGPERQYPRTV